MPKIRHLAIVCMDPEALAKFYCEVFDMKIQSRSNRDNLFVTDGYITVALLRQRAEGKPCGLNHFGFVVEDAEEIARRLAAHDVVGPTDRPQDRVYAEQRATDPEGNNFDISEHGYDRPETVEQRKERKTAPA
jgi:catechol 2,3-dioxygenase-like lactoylglutathione lyase family enzyme